MNWQYKLILNWLCHFVYCFCVCFYCHRTNAYILKKTENRTLSYSFSFVLVIFDRFLRLAMFTLRRLTNRLPSVYASVSFKHWIKLEFCQICVRFLNFRSNDECYFEIYKYFITGSWSWKWPFNLKTRLLKTKRPLISLTCLFNIVWINSIFNDIYHDFYYLSLSVECSR